MSGLEVDSAVAYLDTKRVRSHYSYQDSGCWVTTVKVGDSTKTEEHPTEMAARAHAASYTIKESHAPR